MMSEQDRMLSENVIKLFEQAIKLLQENKTKKSLPGFSTTSPRHLLRFINKKQPRPNK